MHRGEAHLVICGKHLVNGGKLDRISGLNIVNLTLSRSNICYRTITRSNLYDNTFKKVTLRIK